MCVACVASNRNAGTNPELKREVRAYNARKRAALATAESFSKWRIASVKAQLAYEKEAAQKVCQVSDAVRRRGGGVIAC